MDGFLHATRKIMIERANKPTQTTDAPDVPPPAYTPTCCCQTPSCASACPSCTDVATGEDVETSDDDEDGIEDDPSPVSVTLNAATSIRGMGNLIATPALNDATRFSALLLAAVQSLNAKAEAEANPNAAVLTTGDPGKVRPLLKVKLVLNCGIVVNGDRNVIGYRASPSGAGGATTAGAKRKAADEVGGCSS